MVLLLSRLPRFAVDIPQLVAGIFHLSPGCTDIPAQILDRACHLLCQFPQVAASDRCVRAILPNARAIRRAVTVVAQAQSISDLEIHTGCPGRATSMAGSLVPLLGSREQTAQP